MIKNSKIYTVPLLSLILIGSSSSCTSKLPADIQKAVSSAVTITSEADTGGISGLVKFSTDTSTSKVEVPVTTIRIIDEAGKIIKIGDVNKNGQFLITDIPPGNIDISISNSVSSSDVKAVVVAGKITKIDTVTFGTGATKSVTLNITGKVVDVSGNPITNAKVSDVTDGYISNSSITDASGAFSLPLNTFTKARNIEVSSGNLTTSTTITSDKIESITIALIANSRTLKGRVLNSVTKLKGVKDLTVKVPNTTISAMTDKSGYFTLKGVPLTPLTLEVGNIEGYIPAKISVAQASTSDTVTLDDTYIQPIGRLLVNLTADNCLPYYSGILSPSQATGKDLSCYTPIQKSATLTNYYYNNTGSYVMPNSPGSIQVEGTTKIQNFTYPATPTITVDEYISETETKPVTLYTLNYLQSISIDNIPGGEYNLSVALAFHKIQKGIKVVVPSNDVIATELISLELVEAVIGVGDVSGKVLLRDSLGNATALPSGSQIRVVVLNLTNSKGGVLNKDDIALDETRIEKIFSNDKDINSDTTELVKVYGEYAIADSSGSYKIRNVPTGTRVLLAAVCNSDGTLNGSYVPNTYVLYNNVPGTVNLAPDMTLEAR